MHERKFAIAGVPTISNNRLEGRGGDVVIPTGQDNIRRQLSQPKGLSDALFV